MDSPRGAAGSLLTGIAPVSGDLGYWTPDDRPASSDKPTGLRIVNANAQGPRPERLVLSADSSTGMVWVGSSGDT